MSFVKVWVHFVWGTRRREPILEKEQRAILFQHIRENAKEKGIYLDFINGYTDHVHCLVSLDAEMTIAKTAMLLKGESSFWANQNKIFKHKLNWSKEYYAISVSESKVDIVRDYIKNQEAHHQNRSFTEECQEFMKRYGFNKMIGEE